MLKKISLLNLVLFSILSIEMILVLTLLLLKQNSGIFSFSDMVRTQNSPKQEAYHAINQKQNLINEIETTSSTPWSIYRNSDLGFEVKYPDAEYTIETSQGCSLGRKDPTIKHIIFWSSEFLRTHKSTEKTIRDFDIFINDPNDTCLQNPYTSISGPMAQTPKLIQSTQIKIGKYAVLKRDYLYRDPSGEPIQGNRFSTWQYKKDNSYFTLLFENGMAINTEKEESIFLQFLNSFKFISKND